jgi:hypothetical protein
MWVVKAGYSYYACPGGPKCGGSPPLMQTHPFFSPGPGGESFGPQALAKAVPALATVIARTISIATVTIKIMRFTILSCTGLLN